MFTKDHDRNGYNYDSSEVLHKSESQQILLDYTQRNVQKNSRKLGSSGSARKQSAKVMINSKPNLSVARGKDRSTAEMQKNRINT